MSPCRVPDRYRHHLRRSGAESEGLRIRVGAKRRLSSSTLISDRRNSRTGKNGNGDGTGRTDLQNSDEGAKKTQ